MKVEIEQRTPEWHAWRAEGVGASEIAAVLGRCPYKTPYKLWLERTGKIPRSSVNDAMQHGIDHEEEARRNYIAKIGRGASPCCYQHDTHERIRASLDGITNDLLVVQLKCPLQHNACRILETGLLPEYWSIQNVYEQLAVGTNTGEVSVYDVWSGTSREFPIKYDPELAEQMVEAANSFYQCIVSDTPPAMTDRDLDYRSYWRDDEYLDVCNEIARLTKIKNEMRGEMIERGNGEPYRTGLLTIKKQISNKLDYKKYCEALDPLGTRKAEFTKTTESWVVRKAGEKS